MSETLPEEALLVRLNQLFSKPVFQQGTKPFSKGVELALKIETATVRLVREDSGMKVLPGPAKQPDMTFTLPQNAIGTLESLGTTDIGEMGIEIIKLMMHNDPTYRINAKVHIGGFDLLRNGYFSVLAGGGPTVMRYLATKGFSSLGKIKAAISRLKE